MGWGCGAIGSLGWSLFLEGLLLPMLLLAWCLITIYVGSLRARHVQGKVFQGICLNGIVQII